MQKIARVSLLEGEAARGFMMRMYTQFEGDYNVFGKKADQKIGYYKSDQFKKLWIAFDNRENNMKIKSFKTENGAITWAVRSKLNERKRK